MITAKIFRSGSGKISGFDISGHAGYAAEGSDIICAAVSAIAYTAAGYFDEKFNSNMYDGVRPFYSESEGHMAFRAPEVRDRESAAASQAVLEAAVIGLKQIETSYGKKYIRVIG